MNRNSGNLIRAALLSALGLSMISTPVDAGTIDPWGIAMNTTITPYGFDPPPGNSEAAYSSANQGGAPFDFSGLQTNLVNPSSSLTTSPSSMPAGLTGGTLDLSAVSTVSNVSASLGSGAIHMYATSLPDNGNPDSQDFLNAYLQDYLTFSVAGGGSANLDIGLSLDGAVSTVTTGILSYSEAMQLELGGGNFSWSAGANAVPDPSISGTWQSTTLTGDTTDRIRLQRGPYGHRWPDSSRLRNSGPELRVWHDLRFFKHRSGLDRIACRHQLYLSLPCVPVHAGTGFIFADGIWDRGRWLGPAPS